MARIHAASVPDYLAALPPERRAALAAVRKVIRANLPRGYEEGPQFGMIGYYVPLARFPDTYNGQPLCLAALASQSSYMSLYLMCVYGDAKLRASFERDFRAAGKKLNMGKSCVRFKAVDDLPLDVIGKAIAAVSVDRYIAHYKEARKR
jgi:Domain of unknown function (DU1801)